MSLIHIQYYLQNAKINNNSESEFLPNINLFNTYLHVIIYQGVMSDFAIENINL